MMETGIRELRSRLSEYLRLVKAGNTVMITEHGQPIGYIVPYTKPLEEKMQILQESGFLAWSGQKLPPHVPLVSAKGEKMAADIVLEERD